MHFPNSTSLGTRQLSALFYFTVSLLLLSVSPKHGLYTASIGCIFVVVFLAGCRASWGALLTTLSWRNISILALILVSTSLANVWLDFYTIEYHNFDTGIYANQISYYWQTGSYYSPILGIHALGEHFTPALIVFAPLVRYFDTFLVLPIGKVLALYGSAYFIYLISREILGQKSIALLPVIAWFISRPNAFLLEMEFQPSTLAVPLVLLSIFLALKRNAWCLVTLLLLLGFKEHMALVWISLGLYLVIEQRRYKLGGALVVCGLLLGSLIYFSIMPHYAAGITPSHASKFGPTELLLAKGKLILLLLCSVSFLPLLHRGFPVYFLPSLGMSLISNAPSMTTMHFHYHDLSMPFLFLGAIHGLNRLSSVRVDPTSLLIRILFACSLTLFFGFNSKFPTRQLRRNLDPEAQKNGTLAEVQALSPKIKDENQLLYTQDVLGPYFFKHRNLRSILIPTPKVDSASFLICDSVKRYPLSDEQYTDLRQHLRKAVKRRSHQRLRVGKNGKCSLYLPRGDG